MATKYYETLQIDDDFLKRLSGLQNNAPTSRDILKLFTGGDQKIGAQQQKAVYAKLGDLQALASEKMQEAKQKLQAIDPFFDPQKYYIPTENLVNYGEGADANRGRPVWDAALKAMNTLKAIDRATQAATKYQQTGKIDPIQDPEQVLKKEGVNLSGYAKFKPGEVTQKLSGNFSAADMEEANAAAARVGSPLPYPNSKIGTIGAGGVFNNEDVNKAGFNYQQEAEKKLSGIYSDPKVAIQGTTAPPQGYSQGAQELVKQVLTKGGDLRNLQNDPNWSSNPNKQEAYKMIQEVFSNSQNLASFVQQNGITDLQNYSWWSNSPLKKDAWGLIQQAQATGASIPSSIPGMASTASTSTPGTSTGAIGASGTADSPAGASATPSGISPQDSVKAAMDIINNSDLDAGQKMLFSQIVQNWDPGAEINAPEIIKKFQEISKNTIDPYFKEQANIFTDQIKQNYDYAQTQRGIQKEGEDTQARENIAGTQRGLESSGMTFTGEGTRLLGTDSAFGTQESKDIASGIPRFGGQEGLVQKQNRLIATSSESSYMKGLQELSRQAETTLGTEGSKGLVPGVSQLGGIKESAALPSQKAQAQASTLQNLYGQAQQNVEANKPINPFQN